MHEVEIEHVLSPRWMQSFYLDLDQRPGRADTLEPSAIKTEFNFPFPLRKAGWRLRLNVELAKLLGTKDAYGGPDPPDTVEFRAILQRALPGCRCELVLGPMLVQGIGGAPHLGRPTLGMANALLFDVSERLGLGLELHSSLGTWKELERWRRHPHVLMPNVDWVLGRHWSLSAGVGVGLT